MTKTCTKCRVEKDEFQFDWKNRAAGKRQVVCRGCHKVYRDAHYAANRAKRCKQASARRAINAESNNLELAEYLLEHPCVDCGERDITVLEFDHRDPMEKSFEIGEGTFDRPAHSLLAEVAKCDVRCANCHRRKHQMESNTRRFSLYQSLGLEGRRSAS